MNTWSSQSILTNGIRVHYHRTGGRDKPVLLMTHGFTDNGLCWSRTAHELEDDYDILMLDTGATWDGYFCDFDRNFAIGQADDLSHRAYDVLWRATEAGIAAARPGTTCRDLFQTMQSVIAEMDSSGGDVGRLGHGLGMQLTEWPSHAAFDNTVIQENMVLTLEPSLSYGDGRIMVHEEDIVIRSSGAELLTTRAAPELPVI